MLAIVVHRPIPNLRVSPSRSPSVLRIEVMVSMDDCERRVTEKRLLS